MDSRVKRWHSQAQSLAVQFDKGGRTTKKYIDDAIALDRKALKLCPPGHHKRSLSLNCLSNHLCTRYEQFGAIADVDEAIVLDREVLALHPQGHPRRLTSLNNLGIYLSTRYGKLGAISDLNEAIVFAREALALRPQGHPKHSMSLNNLALCLSTRYKKFGPISDLDEAIVLARQALVLHPQGHPDRPMSLNNLGIYLSTRYNKFGTVSDLDEAIILDREALSLRTQGHPDRSKSLNNLAARLSTRYSRSGAVTDLDEAIVLDREALTLRPQGHPDRSISLDNLGIHLSARYNGFDVIADLDEAIILGQEALGLRPRGHPHRWKSLNNLAYWLSTRYNNLRAKPDRNTSSGDLDEAFCLYAQLADLSYTVSSGELEASRAWVRAAENFKHASILLAYKTSLRLLVEHLSLLPSLPQYLVILKEHTSSLAVDAFSACLRNGASQLAVELLEQGRGVFWNQLTRLNSSLDDVIASGAAGEILANKFRDLTAHIRTALHSPGNDQHDHIFRLNHKMQDVVTAIRELPGLSRFLRPPLFSSLQHAAREGPVVVVNASQYTCDALIILGNRDPVHVPLSITRQYVRVLSSQLHNLPKRGNSRDVSNVLGRILRELWDDVVLPVVRFLQTFHPLGSRIWWCPTAEFSELPLHAAGPYRRDQQNLSDLYISSYTPTLNALIRARRFHTPEPASDVKRFVAIGQASAIGQSELLSVGSELARIGRDVGGAATFKRIEGTESRIALVAEELGKNEWVHFACHGLANRKEPFRSAFALRDGHFTIEQIIHCDLGDPEFAYLSACQTTVGDKESPDEAIHLASAMQFLGFRSVIGTMWSVDDKDTNAITSTFYKHMLDKSGRLDYTRAAFALNETMRTVSKVTLDQRVVYIHLGA